MFLVLFALAIPLPGQSPDVVTHYRGFTISASPGLAAYETSEVEAALKEQIDMVYAVGVSDEVLNFFQTVPIVIVSPSPIYKNQPGFYSRTEKNIQESINLIPFGHKPILIHQLLYAFDDQKIEDGIKNQTIINLYDQAKTLNAYNLQSLMMSNNREFFACAATTYLYGVTAQEPFQRGKILSAQPELIEYFKKLLGPNTGTYVGR